VADEAAPVVKKPTQLGQVAQTVETSVDRNRASTLEAGGTKVTAIPQGGLNTDTETGKVTGPKDLHQGDDAPEAVDGEEVSENGETPEAVEDLGAYDPANETVVAAYEKAYITDEGTMNVERLSAEFWANSAAGKEGLHEGTYGFLRERFGLPKDYVKSIEAGQKALAQGMETALWDRVGGKDRYDAAIDWARKGGYTKAQRDRFNAVRDQGGEAFDDAVDALMSRYETKNPDAKRKPAPLGVQRRPSSPAKDVAGGSSAAPGGDGFADYEAYNAAFRAARRSGSDSEQAAVRRKLQKSSWYRAQKAGK
jgi:hypothetical protein